jgi:hypothetical protein
MGDVTTVVATALTQREAPLATLRQALDDMLRGRGRLVLVT